MMKRLIGIFTVLSMFVALLPAVVGAAAEPLEIKLAIGSPTLSVNGVTSTIQQPFQVNGTTLVPLSVITKAFGAGLKLENNKIITLTYNKTSVILTIGSKVVKVNGVPSTLATETKVVNNTTMVPLRVIVSSFGASIQAVGKQITIKGAKADSSGGTNGTNTGGINTDAGKTKVGDSYYGWSLDYPSDLSLAYQSDNGNGTVWADGSGNASIEITIHDVDQSYTREELREFMISFFKDNEFVVEKKSVTIGAATFEKVVSRDRDGWYYEMRGIQKDNRIFIILTSVKSNSRDSLNKYQTLLDSFKTSFSAGDSTLKDITKVKNGVMTVYDMDYGLGVQLPADWLRDDKSDKPRFVSDDGYMDFSISSLKQGETVDQWLKRNRQDLESEFQSDYYRNVTESTIKLVNGTAQVLTYEYTWDKKEWYKEYQVFFVSGAHKYEADFYYSMDNASKGESLFNQIMPTVNINTAYVDANFSEIEDDLDLENLTVTKTSKKYGYSIVLPQSWYGVKKDFEKEEISYNSRYSYFFLNVVEGVTASEAAQNMQHYAEQDKDMIASKAKVTENTSITVGNKTGYKVVVDVPGEDTPYTSLYYIFEKGGKVFALTININTANYTEKNRKQIEQVVASFTLN
ncbi:hypothetical protein Back11_52970 [Paenibacillus baekrokdamisoli]|uniref:Copper amine oxidase-like N-terminal domain-containing protein n=1 Tax=Paenibacillus baekrokdamisoli TaxID=1712516 RepID=A0A3G9J074_9BACL|nr:copper amine oxidase N-terminal domain-containing protein [Paenibacillus baekrokdamisoli]MBB3073327.1 hypothetical protein [Paenibacillus baekrokdamisoli]BBH23952.1 hypothetical protein Back11_52970 [Paenibacillus baekrokdamisoli]